MQIPKGWRTENDGQTGPDATLQDTLTGPPFTTPQIHEKLPVSALIAIIPPLFGGKAPQGRREIPSASRSPSRILGAAERSTGREVVDNLRTETHRPSLSDKKTV